MTHFSLLEIAMFRLREGHHLPLQTLGGAAGPIGQFWAALKGRWAFLDIGTKIGFVLFSTEFLLNFLVVKVPLFGGG
jgi:hypothetical protein